MSEAASEPRQACDKTTRSAAVEMQPSQDRLRRTTRGPAVGPARRARRRIPSLRQLPRQTHDLCARLGSPGLEQLPPHAPTCPKPRTHGPRPRPRHRTLLAPKSQSAVRTVARCPAAASTSRPAAAGPRVVNSHAPAAPSSSPPSR